MRVETPPSSALPAADDGGDRRERIAGSRPVPYAVIEHDRREALSMRRAAIADLAHRLGGLIARPIRRAPASVRAEADLVATMSDRLRTPLTAIRSSAEVLHDNPGMSSEQRARFTAAVVAVSDRLGRAVSKRLDRLERRTQGNRSSQGA